MPSQSKADIAKHGEIPPMNRNAPERRSSLQHQTSRVSNEKVSSRRNRKVLKPGVAVEQNGPDQDTASAVPVMPLGNHPSRKVTKVDDVVKYMSSVPSYLQRLEKGDCVQEKALNFGVLDWRRLEKWTYIQKQVANRRRGDSPSSSDSSATASFSTFGSSSHYTRSTEISSDQSKQSFAMNARRNSSVEGRPTESINEQKSVQVMNNRDSETSHSKQVEKGKGRHSNVRGISIDKPQSQDVGNSSSTSKVDDIPATAHNKEKLQIGRSVGEEKLHSSEQQNFPDNLQFAEDWLQDQCLVVEDMLDHLHESEHARRVSYDSAAVNNGRSVQVGRKSISGNFPPSDYRFANKPPLIPRSCPLPSTCQSDVPSVSSVSEKEVLMSSTQGDHMKPGQFSESLSEKSTAADKFGQGEVKVGAAPRRDSSAHRQFCAGLNRIRSSTCREGSSAQHIRQTTISDNSCEDNVTSHSSSRRSITPHHLLSAGLNRIRNSSLREGSSGKEMKQTSCSDNLQEENAVSGSKSRHSPLIRRILDPLLKSKDQNQEFNTGDKMQIRVGPCRSSDVNFMIPEAGCSIQAEKQVVSTRQALLKLVWKNELPRFVFSANDDNILAATMGKVSISQKNNFNCIYTMFTAKEVQKKGGVWKGQGNKSKKHDLAYNVVGQMRVSSIKSTGVGSNDCFALREFVLLGSELAPMAHGRVNPPFNSELAAIVIRVPYESSDNINELQCNNSVDSSQINSAENKSSIRNLRIEQKNENSGLTTVVAILPSGVHGISSTGEPSPLIERWKSGGSCDCGGWDEGCKLTILTDKNQESRSAASSQACSAAGTDQIELFPQGEDRESKYAFRMTFFQEGVYTVKFGASIALVQAFAICISLLHSRKPHTLSGLHHAMKAQSIQERTSTEHTGINREKTQTGVPARYLPNCPPLSPVSRA